MNAIVSIWLYNYLLVGIISYESSIIQIENGLFGTIIHYEQRLNQLL